MKAMFLIAAMLLILPLASADLIAPGTKYITISNKITNIADFPEFVFIIGNNGPNCQPQIINSSGIINGQYKFCNPSVFAVQKAVFNETKYYASFANGSESWDYYVSRNLMAEIIKGIKTSETVPESSPLTERNVEYKIDASMLWAAMETGDSRVQNANNTPANISNNSLNNPEELQKQVNNKYNSNLYFYIIVPIIALIIILYLLLRKRQ